MAGSNFIFYLPEKKPFVSANLLEAEFSSSLITPNFTVTYQDNVYTVECSVKLPLVELGVEENECVSPMIFQYHNQFFTWANTEDVAVINNFLPSGKMVIKESMWADKLQHFILPLSKNYAVNFGNLEKEEIKDVL